MKEKILFLILRTVKNGSNLNLLLNEGLSYAEIADLTSKVIIDGFLVYDGKILILSEQGFSKLEELQMKHKNVNKEEWIRPLNEFRVAKLNKNDIFLPSQEELSF